MTVCSNLADGTLIIISSDHLRIKMAMPDLQRYPYKSFLIKCELDIHGCVSLN